MAVRAVFRYVTNFFKKKARNYNAIERAEKLMDLEKRDPAPHHPISFQPQETEQIQDNRIQDEILRKNTGLVTRMESMRIDASEIKSESDKKKDNLPQKQGDYSFPDFGYLEPLVVTKGKCTLRQALEFTSNNQNNPKEWNVQFVANKYDLKPEDVQNVFNSFKVFQVFYARNRRKEMMKHNLDVLGVNKMTEGLKEITSKSEKKEVESTTKEIEKKS